MVVEGHGRGGGDQGSHWRWSRGLVVVVVVIQGRADGGLMVW